MRPLSKVETRRGGSIPSLTLHFPPSVFMLFCVFCRSSEFHNWTFTLEQPDGCAATSFGMPFLLQKNIFVYINRIQFLLAKKHSGAFLFYAKHLMIAVRYNFMLHFNCPNFFECPCRLHVKTQVVNQF